MSIQETARGLGDAAQHSARGAARGAGPWVERLARLGYVAKGAVYSLVGLLALTAAVGDGGQLTGSRGVLRAIAGQPGSAWVLGLLALGLAGYGLYRLLEAVLDSDGKARSEGGVKGWMYRAGYAASGVIHASLALTAFNLIRGGAAGNEGSQPVTARLLALPLGQLLVAAVGLFVIAFAVSQFKKGWTNEFQNELRMGEMNEAERASALTTGKVGLISRGVVFSLIGWFFLRAAMTANAGEARGLDAALATIAAQPFGKFLLALVAAGLVAYGAFCFVQARWRRIATGDAVANAAG